MVFIFTKSIVSSLESTIEYLVSNNYPLHLIERDFVLIFTEILLLSYSACFLLFLWLQGHAHFEQVPIHGTFSEYFTRKWSLFLTATFAPFQGRPSHQANWSDFLVSYHCIYPNSEAHGNNYRFAIHRLHAFLEILTRSAINLMPDLFSMENINSLGNDSAN